MSDGTPSRVCSIDDCGRARLAKGFCKKHYQRYYKFGDPLRTGTPNRADRLPAHLRVEHECAAEDCRLAARCKGYCAKHYARLKRTGSVADRPPFACSVKGCLRRYGSRGYCQMHFLRVTKYGDPGPVYAYPPKVLGPDEYVFVTVEGVRVLEHRYVMSQIMGRPLLRHENVHHINGNKHDNRPHNLELWSSSQPPGQRIDDKVVWAVELLALYAPHLLAEKRMVA